MHRNCVPAKSSVDTRHFGGDTITGLRHLRCECLVSEPTTPQTYKTAWVPLYVAWLLRVVAFLTAHWRVSPFCARFLVSVIPVSKYCLMSRLHLRLGRPLNLPLDIVPSIQNSITSAIGLLTRNHSSPWVDDVNIWSRRNFCLFLGWHIVLSFS